MYDDSFIAICLKETLFMNMAIKCVYIVNENDI